MCVIVPPYWTGFSLISLSWMDTTMYVYFTNFLLIYDLDIVGGNLTVILFRNISQKVLPDSETSKSRRRPHSSSLPAHGLLYTLL